MTITAIQCKGIKKAYGQGDNRIDAVKDINIEVFDNQLTMLVGPSGSGKTTLLSIITTILTPDEGQLFLLEHEMSQMNENEKAIFCRKNLGIVFQSLFLIPTLSVVENVALPMIVAGHRQAEMRQKALEILDKMHLAHRADVSPANLSKGQQQRVAIARAMINDPKIIVCDEPTSALDHTVGFEIMTLLQNLARQFSKAVLVVTHDQRTFSFSDRIIEMSDGQITTGEKV